MVAAALRLASVRLQEKQKPERQERPRRLSKLLAKMPNATRDKLADAYEREYGISLPYAVISKTLRQAGISLIEPIRKPDREEVQARGQRLYELAEEYPHLTHDQLGRKYDEVYGVRLPPSTVGFALNRFEVYRHRLADPDELAERPERLRQLAESYPRPEVPELVTEYERLYGISLHPVTVQTTLNSLGLYRRLPVDKAEVAERPARLQRLAKRYPYMNCAQLAQEYERRYKAIISQDSVENALRSLGEYRRRLTDAEEFKERPGRIKLLQQQHPKMSTLQLAEAYRERYGVVLTPERVANALNTLGIFSRRQYVPDEFKQRSTRLKKLHHEHPSLTCEQLAEEYEKQHGCSLTPGLVSRALNQVGIFRQHLPTAAAQEERVQRLKALAAEFSGKNKKDIFEEYARRYGEVLSAESMRKTLRKRGVYQSRAEVTRQRVERLLAIAAEYPDLSKAGIVREYGKRYDEELSISSTLATLRRLGLLGER